MTEMRRHTLREAEPEDLEALMRLEEQSFSSDRFSRAQYERLLESREGTTLVVEVVGEIAGSAIVLWRRGYRGARLYSIAVAPDHRGEGLGRMLLEAAEQAALRHGCSRMSLEVRKDNEAAIELYRTAGYRHSREIPGYYEDGADAVRLIHDFEE